MSENQSEPGADHTRPPPPAVTRPADSRPGVRPVDYFAPPFAGGRTLSANGTRERGSSQQDAVHVPAAAAREPDLEADSEWPLLEEQGAAMSQWDLHETPAEDAASDFPLDAFIIPEDSRSVPSGWTDERAATAAADVADRLEALAARLRDGGLAALEMTSASDALSEELARAVSEACRRYGSA